jgi:hypothetical protein
LYYFSESIGSIGQKIIVSFIVSDTLSHGSEIYVYICSNIYRSSGAATLHGFLQDGHQQDMSSSTTEQSPMAASSLMNPSSNNLALALQQGHHHQEPDHQQMLSNFGGSEAELLLSPTTSPYGFQSSLLRSLMEPTADAAKPALPGYQQQYDQYQQMGMGQARSFAPAGGAASREALQFTNDAPSWNPSAAAGFGVPPAPAPAPAPADQASSSVRSVKPSPAARATATLALKVGTHMCIALRIEIRTLIYFKTTATLAI